MRPTMSRRRRGCRSRGTYGPSAAILPRSALDAVATDAALELIARLPRDQADAVLLRVVMGLDAKTAARVLGKRAGAVRTACYRGLRGLAEHLEQSGSATWRAATTSAQRTSGTAVTQRP